MDLSELLCHLSESGGGEVLSSVFSLCHEIFSTCQQGMFEKARTS